ncbi:CDP-glucose 4,6-dehydratase [Flavobacterium algoritolerans]|jgi:CDP-glucose 4,6-dehydratase|uniref:CDP-glucose 4,6-dehydratase n=1 Tax=Flavobacterium algoritolerans TaxID=3041254 RepID=A0ABT6VBK5_9FLAO|nr:CDP-glucose 4,6-dehydratase [Flavobacterium algoritolerans]MDI5895626.1 CDP-glucose 4,6-dehydratase [Flavobacterium algoritolerans]
MFKKLEEAYKGKRVFLTGHTGFKGAWMLKTLSMLGATVKGYALAPKQDDDLYHIIDGDTLCASVIADLRDKERLSKEILDFEPDFVFHLAAQPLVRLSYEIPAETFEVNALGTAYVLDAVRLLEKKCSLVLITTDKVYQNNEWVYPYRETDRLGGYDPYSASKACTELVIDSYRNSFFNTAHYSEHKKVIAVARAGNVIGGGDWSKDRIIPDIVNSIRNNKVLSVRNPKSIRPWQHVLEPVMGYLLLGLKIDQEPLKFSGAYNFGPFDEDAFTVEDLVKLAISIFGKGTYECPVLENQPHEATLLRLDISKAVQTLGWKPLLTSSEAISLTMNWYAVFISGESDIKLLVEENITTYLNQKND